MDIETIFETSFDADSYIENWLLSIENDAERAFARKHLSGALRAMIRHTEASYQALEARVYAEVKAKPNRHSVYLTVVDRDKFDITNGAWFPLIVREEKQLEQRQIMLPEALPVTIDRFFCPGDNGELQNIAQAADREFTGTVTLNGKESPAVFRLIPSVDYKSKIEGLYTLFQQNAIPWMTVNCGPLLRYFSLQLTGAPGAQPGQTVQAYNVDLEELETLLVRNTLPVWNIQTITYDSDQFVRPAIDTVYYEHCFPFDKYGRNDGYLLSGNRDILSFRQTEEEILVLTMRETFQNWEALRIVYQPPLDLYCFSRPVLYNAGKDSFVSGMTNGNGPLLRSRLEMIRRIHAFDLSGIIKPMDVQLLTDRAEVYDDTFLSVMNVSAEKQGNRQFIPYSNLNWFLEDDLINRAEQKVLLFRFQAETQDPVRQDILSFVLSEMQRQFAEYRCEAEFVNTETEA